MKHVKERYGSVLLASFGKILIAFLPQNPLSKADNFGWYTSLGNALSLVACS